MNERIKELAEQAKIWDMLERNQGISHPVIACGDELQKFAELIVKECVSQLELVRKYRYDRIQPFQNQQTIIDECQYQIKQYFGVE